MTVRKMITWAGRMSAILTFSLLTALALAPFIKEYAAEQARAEEAQKRELQWLAKAIYFEARGEVRSAGLEGMRMVAEVILTRVADPRWPDTVEGVVRQGEEKPNRCQFSFMCDGQPEHITDKASWETALYVASVTYADFKQGATAETCTHSYHADYVKRERFAYFMQLAPEKKVGAHIFYCDQERDAVS